MVLLGPSNRIGGAQSVVRSNSEMINSRGVVIGPSQASFPSLVSPCNQINNNMDMFGDFSNASFPNSGPGSSQHGGVDIGAEFDPPSEVGNEFSFVDPSSSSLFMQSNMMNPGSSIQGHGQQFPNPSGNQLLSDQQNSQQLEYQNFQQSQQPMQQFPAPPNNQQQQQHFQLMRGAIGSIGSVKFESQVNNDQFGQYQQMPLLRNLAPPKLEPHHTDQPLFTHQEQQQLLHMAGQSPQAAAAAAAANMRFLNHQRHSQSQQPQQFLKTVPQQRSQQFQQQDMPIRSPVKPVYEPGICANRLTYYMHQQRNRPKDNSIEFWRTFVAEHFAPNAKKKWCVSMYESGRQTAGVFPRCSISTVLYSDIQHCAICNCRPGRGFEATAEVLPRLFKIKYESGTLQELLYVDMPREYHNSSGHTVLDYAKAIEESVFEKLRVVREGQLRLVFAPDLKICSWEFCVRRHEDLIPKRLLLPQVTD
ncbi:putative LIM-domain binding protein/SEUSS [Lupinus albus]|uniref:Putative LIM-domain binding protein/SEUSS n=1 Tax=Lupinus albus TaxID=3870 RepID=A0A6A4R5T4_LUPAL|nr:putative LIM-domain binding protein/SEUSS [Lupinus albus]